VLIAAATVLIAADTAMCSQGKPLGQDMYKTQVKKVLDDINRAFLNNDVEEFLKYVARDADIAAVDIMAGDYIIGYDMVVEHMRKTAAMKATYKCTLINETIHVSMSARVAWTAQLSDCSITIGEKTVSAKVRSTSTFERRGGRWLLVQGHDSVGLPHINDIR
ncbi:MAG: nuclear transport factor 2 family protein, partial [Nitrospirae bacterium]|nr:nuclear transport factor 2 family protein [Nitrospirota bacterium]